MPLETTLADIIVRLRRARFPNEQAISQCTVLRVLQDLGWDSYEDRRENRLEFFDRPPTQAAEFLRC